MFYQIRSDWESSPEWCDCVCQDGTLKLWEFESGQKLQSCDLTEPEETPSTEADEQKVPAACEDSPVHWHVRPLRRLCVCVLFPRSPLCAGSAALLTLVMSLCSVRGENSAAIWWTNCRTDTHTEVCFCPDIMKFHTKTKKSVFQQTPGCTWSYLNN